MDSVIVSVIIIAGILAIPAWLIYAIAGERGRIAGIALVVIRKLLPTNRQELLFVIR